MKVPIDECVDQRLRHELVCHDSFTVGYMRWAGIRNGRLLAHAAAERFDGLVTTDRGFAYQHNPSNLVVSIYLIYSPGNRLRDLLPFVPALLVALRGPPPAPRVLHIRL